MDRLLEFFGNHPGLVLAFFGILGALAWTVFQGSARGVTRLSPGDATRLINSEDAVVLDVRPDSEFRDGHIINAINVPESELKDRLDKLAKYRDRPVIATCRTGSTSTRAASLLKANGFDKVYNLGGGIVAWEGASLPLTKG